MTDHQVPRILNVDDTEAGRYTTTHVLKKAGFEVLEAASGQEALALAEGLPDLVLLDVNLPDMSGFEVCRLLRANPRTAAIPVVHLSATFVGGDDQASGIEQGADGYLTHPVEPKVLVATLNAFLRLKGVEKALRESEGRFHRALTNSAITVFNQDLDLRYTWIFNPAPVFAATAVLGLTDADLLPAEEALQLTEIKQRVIATGESNQALVRLTLGGRPCFSDLTAEPLRDAEENIVGVTCVAVDVTQRTLAEAQIAEQLTELRRWHEGLLGREGRVLEIKQEVNDLLARLGEPPRYPSAMDGT